MKHICISVILLLSVHSMSSQSHSKEKIAALENDYFGEKPPGLIPKLFDPKLVSPDGRFDHGSFTPDMKEFYFTRKHGKYKKARIFCD